MLSRTFAHKVAAELINRGTLLIVVLTSCFLLSVARADDAVPYRNSDVIYGRKLGLALTAEIFSPKKSNGLGVIWIVSSSGVSSRARTLTPKFQQQIKPFLDQGYKVFAVIHGSAPRFQIQDHVDDATRAVRFVRYHALKYSIDPDRVAIAGSSAGGYVALMVAMQGLEGNANSKDPVDRVQCKVHAAGCFFPPADLMNLERKSENILQFMRRKYGSVSPSFTFYEIDKKTGERIQIKDDDGLQTILRRMSPITHVSLDSPPTILIHGDSDRLVPVWQSQRFVERLVKNGVASHVVVRKGKSHAWKGWERETELIAEWFNNELLKRK